MKIKLLTGAVALLALPAFAQMATPGMDVTSFDTDSDGMISDAEFRTGFDSAGTMSRYDTDGDMMLSEQEYNDGFGNIGDYREEGYEARAFGDLDSDADGMLNNDEYNQAFFGEYDRDQSGMIEEAEFEAIGNDMGEDGLFGEQDS
jgi:Ca2+-binding EF-hand superfamily protein